MADGPIHCISLGAGVQSSTMALMAAHGEITPMPEFAIFADTGWDPSTWSDMGDPTSIDPDIGDPWFDIETSL